MIRVSSWYGPRVNPVTREAQVHRGLDLPAKFGTPVGAVAPGIITRVDRDGIGRGTINGNAVHLLAGPYIFSYLHLAEVTVSAGAAVRAGQLLGRVGSTGRSTGPHLHFAVQANGVYLDPVTLYPPGTFGAAP